MWCNNCFPKRSCAQGKGIAKKVTVALLSCLLLQSCALFSNTDDYAGAKNKSPAIQHTKLSVKDASQIKRISCAINEQSEHYEATATNLGDILNAAHTKLEHRSTDVDLPVEMMFSLFHGLMVPGHSWQVGKEFSMVFRAQNTGLSPTLNKTIDYSVFTTSALNNGNRCVIPPRNIALYRVLMYSNHLDENQWHLLRKHFRVLYSELLHLRFLLVRDLE